ncbi:EamA family transporter RarD [Jiangella alkaliphila]|uniref:Chloramphenicol-sensitive protein RarD n=1 Tax=Jiangella alkaliphila TaxID=419479 RepID=A0A1H2FNG1_9ACTN|nr:EamA family transporter RarD [Jiangella alkaliphila]SDU08913.1 chloramphenicol-sensitive protein RarD [Jiangella alkaliphila]
MSQSRSGVLYGFGAYALWGMMPLYIKLLDESGPAEILAHRVVWSLVFVLGLLALSRRLGRLRTVGRRGFGLLALAALLICANWGVYIWAVNNDHVVETALGYFINPLVTVLLGVLVFGERLRWLQWSALGLAAVAVVILTIDYGRPPWIALALAFSFGAYGLVKKKADVQAVESLAVETAVLFLPALGYLVVLGAMGDGDFVSAGWGPSLLLAVAGVVTAVPLLFFGAAAVRVPLTTLGTLQYLTPTLQFLLGVLLYRETVPPVRWFGFALIWTALVVLTAEVLVRRRRERRAALDRLVLDPTTAAS